MLTHVRARGHAPRLHPVLRLIVFILHSDGSAWPAVVPFLRAYFTCRKIPRIASRVSLFSPAVKSFAPRHASYRGKCVTHSRPRRTRSSPSRKNCETRFHIVAPSLTRGKGREGGLDCKIRQNREFPRFFYHIYISRSISPRCENTDAVKSLLANLSTFMIYLDIYIRTFES